MNRGKLLLKLFVDNVKIQCDYYVPIQLVLINLCCENIKVVQ